LALAGFALSAQAQKPSADLDIPTLSASQPHVRCAPGV
jgi:hypothetical protein